jgi:cytochrome c-type biogenesis protein
VNAQIGLGAAFLAGLASFVSPCVLPMVPGYASFLASLPKRGGDSAPSSGSLVVSSLLFVAGFTAVFVVLGSTASIAGMALAPYRTLLSRLAGAVIIVFGVIMLGVVRLPALYREARIDPARARGLGAWAAPAMGAAFAFGWTPCVGPILGSILVLAGSGSSVAAGAGLLVAYSIGLGVPFVLFAVFLTRLKPVLKWLELHSRAVSRVGGGVLIVFGGLLLTGTLQQVVGPLLRVVPALGG